MANYEFTNNWFEGNARANWTQLLAHFAPSRVLEIGVYEGASSCFLINAVASQRALELHVIDTWEGGHEVQRQLEHVALMSAVEKRFHRNIAMARSSVEHTVDCVIHKGRSDLELSKLLAAGQANYFDFIYIDGSHQAEDVLYDAVLAFKLLRVGGLLAFDDYLWSAPGDMTSNPLNTPKIAIDAFTTIFAPHIKVIQAPLCQLYAQKIAE